MEGRAGRVAAKPLIRKVAVAVRSETAVFEARVRLARRARLGVNARAVLPRDVVDRIDERAALSARTDRDVDAGPISRGDDDVLRLRGAVDEVPRLETAFLALGDENRLAGDDEEVLLGVLRVVHGARLARLEDVDVDPELVEARVLAFEEAGGAELGGVVPVRVTGVQDEPDVAGRTARWRRALRRSPWWWSSWSWW